MHMLTLFTPGLYVIPREELLALFFKDLSDVLDQLVTFINPVFVIGDLNVRLNRPSDPDAGQFKKLLTTYGLVKRVTTVSHDRGFCVRQSFTFWTPS